MRDRLTKRNSDGSVEILKIASKLADYEDLEEQGKLIVLPCKLGEKVYCILEEFDEVMEGYVRQFVVVQGIYIVCEIRGHLHQIFHSIRIGKTVFFTREEAKRALKERK